MCSVDSFDHNVEVITDSIKRIRLQRDRYVYVHMSYPWSVLILYIFTRYLELEEENIVIKDAIEHLKEKMSRDSAIHGNAIHKIASNYNMSCSAQEMHATNAGMRQMRQQMEATFRKELVQGICVFTIFLKN